MRRYPKKAMWWQVRPRKRKRSYQHKRKRPPSPRQVRQRKKLDKVSDMLSDLENS